MIKMDQRGQISIEFVLVIAFMLVIVILVGSYASEQNEISSITAAARTGATDAITIIAITNKNLNPTRINEIRMNGSGQNLTLLLNISGPISIEANRTVFNATIQSMAKVGNYGINTNNNTNLFDDVVVTGRHNYGVIIV